MPIFNMKSTFYLGCRYASNIQRARQYWRSTNEPEYSVLGFLLHEEKAKEIEISK